MFKNIVYGIKIFICLVFAITLINKKVLANNIFFIDYDNNGNEIWNIEKVLLKKSLTEEEKIKKIISVFFESDDNKYIPKDVKILSVQVFEKHLTLDVSEEIKDYGGAFYELALKKQLLKTISEIDNIDKVTLLIEGEATYLPEGTEINETTVPEE